VFASQLAQLPQLTELSVTKGYTQGSGELPQAPHEGSATFERFLHSLKKLKGLQILQVAAINDDVSISRWASPPLLLFLPRTCLKVVHDSMLHVAHQEVVLAAHVIHLLSHVHSSQAHSHWPQDSGKCPD